MKELYHHLDGGVSCCDTVVHGWVFAISLHLCYTYLSDVTDKGLQMSKKRNPNGITKNCNLVTYEGEQHTSCTYHRKYVNACFWCDRAFHCIRPTAEYCSNACRQAHHRKYQLVLPGFNKREEM